MTRRFSEIIEAHIRRYPTEWVWWHKRWRRRPVPNLDLDSRIDYQNNVLQGAEENRHG
jgi:lauroyl/myristoyl acyltransferase